MQTCAHCEQTSKNIFFLKYYSTTIQVVKNEVVHDISCFGGVEATEQLVPTAGIHLSAMDIAKLRGSKGRQTMEKNVSNKTVKKKTCSAMFNQR